MISDKSYMLIDITKIDKLYILPKDFDYLVAIYSWLIYRVELELKDQLGEATIEILKVTHHDPTNSYPGLGIYHPDFNKLPHDLGNLVTATMDRLLQETPAIEMLNFICTKGNDWKAKTEEIMNSY